MNLFDYLPYVLKKKINKTGEARSGSEIYKKRNRRDYRVLIQYKTWNKLINIPNNLVSFKSYFNNEIKSLSNIVIKTNDSKQADKLIKMGLSPNYNVEFNLLSYYEEGYAVIITPEEYFGENYPAPSKTLNSNFELGKTGFILYTTIEQYRKFPLLEEWSEVFELSNTGYLNNNPMSWGGEFALNIKNANPKQISTICGKKIEIDKLKKIITEKYSNNDTYKIIDINNLPKQKGLGNYDYDYASNQMIDLVKKQMLYLCLKSKTKEEKSASQYFKENIKALNHKDDTKTFFNNISSENYFSSFEESFIQFEKECLEFGLLDFEKLYEIGVWNKYKNVPTCPLCSKELYIDEFFEDIEQMEGREVTDNTQKQIVLMHVKALQPGELNHSTYNLGWGHHFCNTIQGDKSISETIDKLKDIIKNRTQ